MEVDVEKWIVKDKKNKAYDIVSYKVLNKEFCCEGIKKLPIDLHYTVPMYDVDSFYNGEDDSGIALGLMLEELYTWFDGEDTQEDTRYHLINYCPLCGGRISINIVREIDKTEEYYNLKAQYDNVHKQWMKCDSKKESAELEKQWRNLSNVINGFYETDSIKESEDN
jgi:hypothetical protein